MTITENPTSGAHKRSRPVALVASVCVLLLVVLGGAIYASPYMFPRLVKNAAVDSDRDRLEDLIDFPRVREGLKGDLKAVMVEAMQKEMGKSDASDSPLAAGFAQFAVGMAGVMVDNMVDQIVTPAGVEKFANGKPTTVETAGQTSDPLANVLPRDAEGKGIEVKGRYLSFDRFRYTIINSRNDAQFAIDLHRQGLFGWRLARITPKLNFDELTSKPKPPVVVAASQVESGSNIVGPADATTDSVIRFVGDVDADTANELMNKVSDSVDNLVGLQIRVEPSTDDDFAAKGYLTSDNESLVISSKEFEMLAPKGSYRWEHGAYIIDGFFLVKSGGFHQGVASLALEEANEAELRLRPNTTISDQSF